MVAGKLFSYPENFRALKVLICSKYGGHDIKLDSDFQFGTTNLTKQFLSKFPLGKVPCVELDTGKLMDETNSMAWQLCPGEMTGEQDKEKQAEVIRWMTLSDVEVTPPACNWVYPVIGVLPHSEGMARGKQDLLKLLTQFNSELRLKTWLVGERISLADICLACSLLLVFTHVMDQEIKDRLPHLTRWFTTVVNQKKVKEVLDQVDLSRKAEGKILMLHLCSFLFIIYSVLYVVTFLFYAFLFLDIQAASRQLSLGYYHLVCVFSFFLFIIRSFFNNILYHFSDSTKVASGMADKVAEVTEAMKDVTVEAAEDDSQVKKGEEGSLYTSETRGSDEAGEGTYRVPFKTVMKVSF